MKNFMKIKTLAIVIALQFIAIFAISQTAKFNYQAVVRDNLGNPLVNTMVDIDVRILQGAVDGTEVFAEYHEAETNGFGLVNLQIGSVEDLSVVDWSADTYFFEVSVDGELMGTSQLLSVPMAVSATYAENYDESDPVYSMAPASTITNDDINDWSAAYSWGDHAGLYLPSDYTPEIEETDPIYNGAPASTIAFVDIGHWNQAYLWGDHAGLYLPSDYSETDPVYAMAPASTITNDDINDWSTAYSWGDHSGLYLPSDYTPDFSDLVNKTEDQDVAGIKNFTGKVKVTTPVSNNDAVPKEYVDELIARIDALEYLAGLKVEDWEGNVYDAVLIGDQIWMSENLKSMRYNDGTPLDYVTDDGVWSSTTNGSWTTLNHDYFTYHDTYGHLYNWYAVNAGNLCPVGWHVPSQADFDELETYLTDNGYGYGGSGSDIGKSLASTELWQSSATAGNVGNDVSSNNSSGFTALPGGFIYGDGSTIIPGSEGYFWTSDEYSSTQGYYRALNKDLATLHSSISPKIMGFSVRCIKD